MRLFPKFPEGTSFWRKWNVFCIMFIGGTLLASRFYKDVPDVVDSAENMVWIGGIALTFGVIMQYIKK